jgi:hypothetical protein
MKKPIRLTRKGGLDVVVFTPFTGDSWRELASTPALTTVSLFNDRDGAVLAHKIATYERLGYSRPN